MFLLFLCSWLLFFVSRGWGRHSYIEAERKKANTGNSRALPGAFGLRDWEQTGNILGTDWSHFLPVPPFQPRSVPLAVPLPT
jgi:hypothetical protein